MESKELHQDDGKVCIEITKSSFTNCTAVLVYNETLKQCYYLHLSPMFGNSVIAMKKNEVTVFMQAEGRKIAWIIGRSINHTEWIREQCKYNGIQINELKLKITQKLRDARDTRRVDLAWFLTVYPVDGKFILDDRAQDGPVEYNMNSSIVV